MDLDSNPDETNRKAKAVLRQNGSRSGSLPGSWPDSPGESSTLVDSSFRNGSGHSKRHGALDTSFPKVHSSGRAVDGVSIKVSQPDLINYHNDFSEDTDALLLETSEASKTISASLLSNPTFDSSAPSGFKIRRRDSDAAAFTKLNVPGNSVVVTESDSEDTLNPCLLTVVAADKLQPYPPGSITIVKETPSSLLLAAVDKELEEQVMEISQSRRKSSSLATDLELKLSSDHDGTEASGCRCRLDLEDRLQSAFASCIQLKNQMELSDSKCARWEQEAGESAETIAELRVKAANLEMELSARNASIHALKAKVAQKHVHCDELNVQYRKIERDLKAQSSQIDRAEKSEVFYREQYHVVEVERSTLQKQVMSAEEEKILFRHQVEKLESELKRLQNHLVEVQEQALKDKQKFTRRLEMVLVPSSHCLESARPIEMKQNGDDPTVSELRHQLQDLQVSFDANKNYLASSQQEHQRLLSRNLQLQRELSSTKISHQEELDRHSSAAKDRDRADAELKERDRSLALVNQLNSQLSMELEGLRRERSEHEKELQRLTCNFTNVSSQYRLMKAETQKLQRATDTQLEELRQLRAERDSLSAQLEEGASREQAAKQELLQLQLRQRQAEQAAAQVGQLEHQVMALKESLDVSRAAQQATQQRADELERQAADRAELAKHNEQLQLQVDSLSQVLQENTGSRLRATGTAEELMAQLRRENGQLHGQVQRSTARLGELTCTIRELEAEVAALRMSKPPLQEVREEEEVAEVAAAVRPSDPPLQEVREEEEVAEVAAAVRPSDPPLREVREEVLPCDQLAALRDANNELTQYAAALQGRLARLGGAGGDRPDLVSSSERAQQAQQDGEEAGLLALLRVCLTRARTLVADHGGDGDAEVEAEAEGEGEAEALTGIRRCLERLTASVEQVSAARQPGQTVSKASRREELVRDLLSRLKEQILARKAAEQRLAALEQADTTAGAQLVARVATLEQELAGAHTNIKELHKQLFSERRDGSQLRKEVASLRLGLETANDMLDNNKIALGRTEAYGEVLKMSKEQLQARFEREQREHEDCRQRLEQLAEQLQAARAKDPLLESQIKTLGCHLHQRSGEVRALQGSLSLRDQECADLRAQLERQKAAARREYEGLQVELQQAQREFAEALKKVNSTVPDPMPCDEEGIAALIQESNRLSPAVLDDLKTLLYSMKAELKAVESGLGYSFERTAPVVQHV